ncbi:MAG: hypothetical protein GQ523_10780 [Methanophagales archaeon]|nr:hypothetical protein [Methanophagales archaeon]
MTPKEEEAEKLVRSFYNYLKQEKGLSEETASAHADHIRFFALHYLIGYEEKNLPEVTGMGIKDYLGNWYIRKVWGGGKSDVRPILVAFKKFYMFLHERGSVDKDQLDDILSACKNPRRYIRRFESYDELDPDSETWDIDYEAWFMDEYDEEELEENYEQPFEVNERISSSFSKDDLSTSRTTVLNDFQTFLTYLSTHNGMKLTAANSFISRRDLFALNEAMSSPEELKNTANQPDSRTIHLFYTISKTLNLFVVSANNKLEVTPRIDLFKQLSQKEQFVVLFDALWNETRWGKILPPDSEGSPESVKEERGNIASALSECEVDKKYQFVDWVKEFCRVPGSAEDELSLIIGVAVYLFSVFEERIVPALTIFGLLNFGFKKDRKEYLVNHGLGIEWFTITKLGKKIFQGIRY